MIVKLLGILDIFIAVCFWIFGVFNISFLNNFILVLGVILLFKGIIFVGGLSIASILDIFCSFVIISSSSFALPRIVVIIISLFLLQKGVFSLLS